MQSREKGDRRLKTVNKTGKHIIVIASALLVLYGIPFTQTGMFRNLISGKGLDAISAATTILDAPSGDYIVMINKDDHREPEKLKTWENFFLEKDYGLLFDDAVMSAANGDVGGIDMARRYQSRLSKNQMKLHVEDPILMLSKADAGRIDFMVMSKEAAETYHADHALKQPQMEILNIHSEPETETGAETEGGAETETGTGTERETGSVTGMELRQNFMTDDPAVTEKG